MARSTPVQSWKAQRRRRCASASRAHRTSCRRAVFSFFYIFKKQKFQKYMSVLKYFKNIPRSPPQRATGPKCNFFSLNLQRGPWKKGGPVAPPTGDRGLSPSPRATAAGPSPRARQGACRPPWATGAIKAPALPFPPHLSPKIPPKIQKKREG